MRTTLALSFAALALSSTGCFRLPGFAGLNDRDPGVSTSNLRVTEVEQTGDMGNIRGFAGGGDEVSASSGSSGSYVRIDTLGRGWWVMSALNFSEDLNSSAFAPGTRRVYTNGIASDGGSIGYTGCSGPSLGNYTYDGGAQQIEVEIEDAGRGARRMNFIATHRDGTVSEGTFVYEPTDSSGI